MRAWWILVGLLGLVACDDGGGDSPPPMADMEASGDMLPDAASEPEADSGEADMPAGVGELGVSSTFVDFGTIGVGDRTEQEIVLSNSGDGPVTVTALEGLQGGFGTSRQPPIRIPAGADRTLVLEFRPAAAGRVTATLTLVTDVGDPVEIQLVGVGGEPEGMLVTDLIDFGTLAPGEPGAAFIQVTSLSEIPLTVRAVEGVMPPFSIPEGQVPATAEGGVDAQILVQFQAEEEGEFEQMIMIRSDAGDWPATLRARAVAVGDLVVNGVEPAWGPTDAPVTLTIHGGPFNGAPTRILVGAVELEDIERIDPDQLRGVLPAGGAVTGTDADQWDVRVEIGGQFGLAPRAFVRTGPVAEGADLDAAALAAGSIGPAGNPWRLTLDVLPAEQELQVAPGTVVLCDARTLSVEGVLRTGGDEGINVFSAAAPQAGAWGGLRFVGASDSSLQDTVVEFAGVANTPAITVSNTTPFTHVRVRRSAGHGIEVTDAGTLVLLGGQFTDLAGDAIRMLGEGGWFRLTNTWIRRVTWPVAAAPNHFGQRPLGLGNDWLETREEGIGIGGTVTGEVLLGNQPDGVQYGLRTPLVVAQGGTLSLAMAAPLRLTDTLTVEGRLVLPGGVRIATPGGALLIAGTGTLQATGTPAAPVTFEARAPGEAAIPGAWAGIRAAAGATLEATRLIVRDGGADGPAVQIAGDLGGLNGLRIDDSADAALQLGGDAEITTLELRGNARGVLIDGGRGRLAGVSEDPAPAVEFAEQGLCGAWDTAELLDRAGAPASTNCE